MKTMLFLLILFLATGCVSPPDYIPPYHKYTLTICNNIGCEDYDCESYNQNGNTYKLLDSAGVVIEQITISNGYFVKIALNKPVK